MRLSLKISSLCLILGVVACSANWGRVVRYSPEKGEEPVLVGAYKAVLADFAKPPWPDSIALQAPDDAAPLEAMVSGGGTDIPSHWADTLRREVRRALDDCGTPADSGALTQAARALGLVLLPSDTTEWPPWSGHSPPPRVRLSRPGFNADSTIAAVRLDYWCGPLCGSGRTLLLARRPGLRWRVWYALGHWIS
jgi:hypothetical protein